MEIEQAPREYDLNRAAELKYGKLAQLERQLADEAMRIREQGNMQLIKEEVDEDDIAAVVSRWTGIPVSRLLEGEKEKLLRLAEHLHKTSSCAFCRDVEYCIEHFCTGLE